MTTKALFPSQEAVAAAASSLGCSIASVRAVSAVEAPLGAFLPTGEPMMLFERHLFDRFTFGAYRNALAIDVPAGCAIISSPASGGYGPYWAQPLRLAAAAKLDRPAALRATSLGAWQLLGDNHAECGFPRLQDFVDAMWESVDKQLAAFVAFVKDDPRLVRALQRHDWQSFALIFNGRRQADHDYAGRIAKAYQQLVTSPGIAV